MSRKGLPLRRYAESRMAKARVVLGWTQRMLADRAGLHHLHVSRMETGSASPGGERGWTPAARSIADALGFTCEDLWPEHAPKVPRLPRPEAPMQPDCLYLAAEAHTHLRAAVAKLPPRDAAVIAMRFALDDEEAMSLPDVGAAIGASGSRAQQIELRALAELAKMLKREGLHV